MELKLNKLSFDQIKIGDVFSFRRCVSKEDILGFANLTGDQNPLHTEKGVSHGMLLGGFFSALVGMLCPGERSLYISQNLNFRNPVNAGDEVFVEGRVVGKSEAVGIIEIETKIFDPQGAVAVDGIARVQFRNYV